MNNTYTLSTETINDIIKRIPQERWEAFCNELSKYLDVHYNMMLAAQEMYDLGFGFTSAPSTFNWVDDGKGIVNLKVVLKEDKEDE